MMIVIVMRAKIVIMVTQQQEVSAYYSEHCCLRTERAVLSDTITLEQFDSLETEVYTYMVLKFEYQTI